MGSVDLGYVRIVVVGVTVLDPPHLDVLDPPAGEPPDLPDPFLVHPVRLVGHRVEELQPRQQLGGREVVVVQQGEPFEVAVGEAGGERGDVDEVGDEAPLVEGAGDEASSAASTGNPSQATGAR
ncbi:hypothetical protein [Nonomuraea terrae]|uniref:hypothetical protein n=1 Tax=Nonomuraea terrae TaxID=2530383 RepID=UPI0014055D1F|nr:hypothetical protein [Nonomuraea terrae]